jgi:E3 ubiquitin-protein ligase NEDD4
VFKKTFSIAEDRFGEQVVVELRSGGANQVVTESNKDEYVDLVVTHQIEGRIKEQFHAFMEGLGDVLRLDLLCVFDEHELELLIGGTTEIDIDDWMRFTDYVGYEKTDPVIEWFWACVRSWPAERKARLLQFTTGTPRVPVDGFDDLQGSDRPRHFTIEKREHPSELPRSQTCFNRLYLPPYEDYESLEHKLCYAIQCVCCLLYTALAQEGFFVGRRQALGRSKCDLTTKF